MLDMLHNDVFGGAGKISKDHFMQVRGDSKTQGFWMIVKQIAVEKFNMKEVFDMQSTVRLTAVENLGGCVPMCVCMYVHTYLCMSYMQI